MGEQGGGLIVVAGPVNACRGVGGWVQDPAMSKIRNLYPVEFPGRLAATENNMYSTREPWPLDFTREGLDADFLWLADTATASRQAWAAFPGVYSCCPVRGPKAGATVYARFSDPAHCPGRPAAGLFRRAVLRIGAACFTWAAARCGGSAPSTTPISSSSTRN